MKNVFKCFALILFIQSIFSFNSCKKEEPAPPITDTDGNKYNTVTIGTQVWMVENLKTTKYRNGDLIGTTTPATLDITAEPAPKYQWAYEGNENNVATYGRLYTWFAATDPRGICPVGWHVPGYEEWFTLISFQGGTLVAQDKLKEAGAIHWLTLNEGATNSSGFTALPGGLRYDFGGFADIGAYGNWWSSDEYQSFAYFLDISSVPKPVLIGLGTENWGFSVRCLRD
jgi:uncharacterized protein (TIGR02145 family)